jgi:hypothetical protein
MQRKEKRALTEGEAAVLVIIQAGYGPHNSIDRVYFSPADEAVLFCRLANGMNALFANLSNLAARRADGTIADDDELRTKYLRLK